MALAGSRFAALYLVTAAALVAGAPATQDSTFVGTASTVAAVPNVSTESPLASSDLVDPMEEPCLRAGGLCLLEVDCPSGKGSAIRGLCPKQQQQGVECCHGLSVQERRCSARGGECRPKHKCGRSLWEEYANNCQKDETCCILVK